MRRCPRCNRIYSEDDLNFCLDDGELLQGYSDEQPTRPLNSTDPPTMVMDSPRVTNPIGWETGQPIGQWQGKSGAHPQMQYHAYSMIRSPNQTLAVVSLILGSVSLVIGWCCSSGLLIAPAGIITGIIALVQAKKDPQLFGGKGLAYGGIGAGSLFLLVYLFILLVYGLAVIGSSLGK